MLCQATQILRCAQDDSNTLTTTAWPPGFTKKTFRTALPLAAASFARRTRTVS
jgi:hypothetical protein